ncbi:hypothetical protein E2C01_068037 [Portunus trituberculatus]|uniref:Uncharacterized protein n=1 Tax=Portunus trituberculatus TaxID=210409 RepID=A0A5B7HLE5_PORTR|nr:hypothetical protein [Portunus trituberculatus]
MDNPSAWTVEVMDNSAVWPNNPDHLPSEKCLPDCWTV